MNSPWGKVRRVLDGGEETAREEAEEGLTEPKKRLTASNFINNFGSKNNTISYRGLIHWIVSLFDMVKWSFTWYLFSWFWFHIIYYLSEHILSKKFLNSLINIQVNVILLKSYRNWSLTIIILIDLENFRIKWVNFQKYLDTMCSDK